MLPNKKFLISLVLVIGTLSWFVSLVRVYGQSIQYFVVVSDSMIPSLDTG
jgi:signal peptidase I